MALTPRVTTRVLPGGIRETTESRIVNTTLIPFIRSRKVFFKMEGLLPNTKHRPYFDGIDVSVWCREETFVRVATDGSLTLNVADPSVLSAHPEGSSDLISDANGTIEGSFFIPNTDTIRFGTGTREFKVLDFAASTDANAVSKAFASYTATGTLDTQQTTITTIRPVVTQPPRFIDPVAQSFLIEKQSGAYVTSVDVYFKTKAAVTPVRLQLREMQTGLPTTNVVPGAEKMLAPASVNVSADASSATTFTFDSPVYLEGFREYAIVVLAESIDYEIWTAVTQEFLVGSTTSRITKQPSLGSFFKSQNGSTWTPDQSRDLKFQVKRAAFNIGSTTNAYFENVPTQERALEAQPIETTDTESTVRVYMPNHGYTVGSNVLLSGCVDTNGITAAQLNTALTVTDAGDFDSFVVNTAGTATSTGRGGGTAVNAETQLQFDIIYPNANQLLHPNTGIEWGSKFTSGSSPTQIETDFAKDTGFGGITVNANNPLDDPQMIASPQNETDQLGGDKSMTWRAALSSDDDYVAPIIDLGRLSGTLIRNRIDNPVASAAGTGENIPNNYVAETDARSGTAAAKHIFVPITLEEEAIGLKVFFAANRPADTYIDLYWRVAESGSDVALNDTDWTLATIDQAMPTDNNPDTFREYEYTIEVGAAFTRYQYKIVFRSQTTSAVPRISDYRSIALAT